MPSASPTDAMTGSAPPPADLDVLLRDLLRDHPEALVVATSGDTAPRRVPLPESLGIDASRAPSDEGSMLERLVPEDRAVVPKLWGQARTRGAAVAPVRLIGAEKASNLYMLDLRRDHGVIVVVFTEDDASPAGDLVEGLCLPVLPPRLARAGKDASAVIVWAEPALTRILGWSAEELIGRRIIELVHPDDRETGISNWLELLDSSGPGRPVRLRHLHRDGSWVWLQVTNDNRLEDPGHNDVLAEMVDISEEMEALDGLHAREQLLLQLTETVPVGLLHADLGGNLLYSNSRMAELTGISTAENLFDQFDNVVNEDRSRLESALLAAADGAPVDIDVAIAPGPERAALRYCRLSLRPLYNEWGGLSGLTGCVEDITATVRRSRALEVQATTDPLTGCLNRSATLTQIQDLLDIGGPGTAVIFVDLDGFKPVNDDLGHAAGDEVLVEVAGRLRSSVRASDSVGRFGGDEFVVVCPDVFSAEHALDVARQLASRAFDRPLDVAGGALNMSASLGVAWSDRPRSDPLILVQEADTAMYQAKREGHSPVLHQP